MTRAAWLGVVTLVACTKRQPDLLPCGEVAETVARSTLRGLDFARPAVEPYPWWPHEDDPEAARVRGVDHRIDQECSKRAISEYGPCARKVVVAALAARCEVEDWPIARRRCMTAATDYAAVLACAPGPIYRPPANPQDKP